MAADRATSILDRVAQSDRTARVSLRGLVPTDAAAIADLAGSADMAGMAGNIPYPLDQEAAATWIADVADGDPSRRMFAIVEDRAPGRIGSPSAPVGMCGYVVEPASTLSIGYLVGKPYWGRGYATAAARSLIEACDTTIAPSRYTASLFLGNDASARVLDKLGFILVGTGHARCPVRGLDLPTLRYERRCEPRHRLHHGSIYA